MLINFAYQDLSTIECSCLEYDGHSVANLISRDSCKRAKGFMADRFIKPPVDVTIHFKCDVDISKIVVNPRVGSQKSSGFQLFKLLWRGRDVNVAETILTDDSNDSVIFSKNVQIPGINERNVRFCSERALDRVRGVKLKIFKTSGSTLPALGSIEIWGQTSRHVNNNLKKEIYSLWKSIDGPKSNNRCNDEPSNFKTESPKPSAIARVASHVDVPEEFIDPISCEIMAIPMTLPSGNIVDVSTLDKFYEAEEKLGRGRSDPFTGVLFTDRSKPVVAASLKSRLDKFLLDNCDLPSIKTIPRALGRKIPLPPQCEVKSVQSPVAHSSNCSQSIDQLLHNCLDGLPSYLETLPRPKKAKFGCVNCSSTSSAGSTPDSSYLFKLPCGHLVCRICLCSLKNCKNNICAECHKTFDFHLVVRYHL